MGFNKGEWSELYTFLYLIDNPKLVIVDENLKKQNDSYFQILEFILNKTTKYIIVDSTTVTKIKDNVPKDYPISYISTNHKLLLDKILVQKSSKGSFDIPAIEPLIKDLLDGNKLKGSSQVKGDLNTKTQDNIQQRSLDISYNVKSNLGASATLLNASSHTNFVFKVNNINDLIMNKSNSICTKNKLIDKCNYLIEQGATFDFIETQSSVFKSNLRLIDSNLDQILAKILLLSYINNEKNINTLLGLIATDEEDLKYYKKKLGDFANAVTFGMSASKPWDGTNEVNGGIIVVSNTGEVFLLDLIYFKDSVDKYLIDNIKLESPSSTRYGMFNVCKQGNDYFFTLNLQVRFK